MKHKKLFILMSSMLVFLFSSIIVYGATTTPVVTLNSYSTTISSKTSVKISGSVSTGRGQNVTVKKGGSTIASTKVSNTGGRVTFSLTIPKSKISMGSNTFKVYSEKKKYGFAWRNVLKKSNPKTFTVTYKKPEKKSQSISVKSNITGFVNGKFNINAKASSGLKCSYKSSNPKVALVTSKGKVTVKKPGKVTITVSQSGNTYYKAASSKKVTVTCKYNKSDDMLDKAKGAKQGSKSSTPHVVVTQFNYHGSYGRTRVYDSKSWKVLKDSVSTGSKQQAKGNQLGTFFLKGQPRINIEDGVREFDRPASSWDPKSSKPPKFHEFYVVKYGKQSEPFVNKGNAIHTHLYKPGDYKGRKLYSGSEQKLKSNGKIDYKNISGGCTRVNDSTAQYIYNYCKPRTPYKIYNYK